jgi:hypothetical protein
LKSPKLKVPHYLYFIHTKHWIIVPVDMRRVVSETRKILDQDVFQQIEISHHHRRTSHVNKTAILFALKFFCWGSAMSTGPCRNKLLRTAPKNGSSSRTPCLVQYSRKCWSRTSKSGTARSAPIQRCPPSNCRTQATPFGVLRVKMSVFEFVYCSVCLRIGVKTASDEIKIMRRATQQRAFDSPL